MKLVVLGSGTANPHPHRSSAAFWLETDRGSMMLDFGASALHRIAQEKLDWANLDAIWISHFHLDHCCGLAAYLFATKYAPETQRRLKLLRVFGGNGIEGLVKNFDEVNNYGLFKQPFRVEIVEVEPLRSFEILPELSATAMPTPHTDESLAIRLEGASGVTLVYTSDTGYGEELAVFAEKADLLIVEASFFSEKKTPIHLNLSEAISIIRESGAKRAMLTHLYAEWDDVGFAEEVAKLEPHCEVLEARDGLRLEVKP